MTPEEYKSNNTRYVSINRKYEQKYFPLVRKTLKAKVSSLIAKAREDGVHAAIKYLHLNIGNYPLVRVVEALYNEVGLRHARINEIRLRKEVRRAKPKSAQTWQQFIENYLRKFLLDKITFKVNTTTRDVLLTVLNQAIDKGWGVDEIVKRLEQLPFTDYQAARIVRTEVNRASNVGVFAQGSSFEYELQKEWVSVRDRRTRGNPIEGQEDHADHWNMNGQTVDFFDHFHDPRNGHLLMFPGDPKADAEDTIFCRCQSISHAKRDKNGRLIPRKSLVHVEQPRTRERLIVTI